MQRSLTEQIGASAAFSNALPPWLGQQVIGHKRLQAASEGSEVRSANAAKEIKALVMASSEQVRFGVTLLDETGAALQVIVRDVQEINGHVNAIMLAARAVDRSKEDHYCG